jgi:nucleoid DNA-binding protein
MTKSELINQVVFEASSKGVDITKKDAASVIDSVFAVTAQEVAQSGKFSFPGFGTFTKKHRKARKGINPQTKAPLTIPASNTVSFKPAPTLKELVN